MENLNLKQLSINTFLTSVTKDQIAGAQSSQQPAVKSILAGACNKALVDQTQAAMPTLVASVQVLTCGCVASPQL